MIGLIVVVIGQSLGVNCGYAINPARDLGPRIYMYFFTDILNVFTCELAAFTYWIVPVFGTIIGGILGNAFYKVVYEWLNDDDADITDSEEVQNLKA